MRILSRPSSLRSSLRFGLLLLVCLVPMFISSIAEADASQRSLARERLILAFGDSLTAGYGLKSSESFPVRLEARLRAEGHKVRVHNAGMSGDTTTDGKARLSRVLTSLKRKPDLAIVQLGANDMFMGFDPRVTEANLNTIVSDLNTRGIPVILAGMYDTTSLGFSYFDQFNAIYPRVTKRQGATLYPFFMKDVVLNDTLLLRDRVHPNAQGADTIARNILPTIRAELGK